MNYKMIIEFSGRNIGEIFALPYVENIMKVGPNNVPAATIKGRGILMQGDSIGIDHNDVLHIIRKEEQNG